jgi:hypothetical protein
MAVTTVPNPFRHVDTGVYTFFGYQVPEGVYKAELRGNVLSGSKEIVWVMRNDPDMTIHHIDFPHATEENILAVLAAMRLSC